MGKKLKYLSPVVVGVVIIVSLVMAYIFGKEKAQAPMPPASQSSTNSSSVTPQTPVSSPDMTVVEDETLEMCLKRASDSEAQESIIKEWQQACRQRYPQ